MISGGKLKDLFLRLKYGYTKRTERLKIKGMLKIAPVYFRHDEGHYKSAAIIDISSSGMAIESFKEFNMGEEIIMVFNLPKYTVSIHGTITRQQKMLPTWIYGVKFDTASTEKKHIKHIIEFAKSEWKKMEDIS